MDDKSKARNTFEDCVFVKRPPLTIKDRSIGGDVLIYAHVELPAHVSVDIVVNGAATEAGKAYLLARLRALAEEWKEAGE